MKQPDAFGPDFRDERLRRLPAGKDPAQFEDYCGPFDVETIVAYTDLVVYKGDDPNWDITVYVTPKSSRMQIVDKVGERWMLSFDYPSRR